MPEHPQDGKDEADHQQDDPECPEDGDAYDEPDDEQDDPEGYQVAPRAWSN